MTSRAEAHYPLLRRHRKRRSQVKPALAWLRARTRLVAVALLALAALAGIALVTLRPPRPDPQRALADALTTLSAGNHSAARTNAMRAVSLAPGLAAAHAVLARAYLELDDGLAAEAEVRRAHDAGMPTARLHQLLAHARLLQGDVDGALAQAARAIPRYAAYATRIRARALAASGDIPAAQTTLIDLLARSPDDRAAWRDLARIRLSAGDIGGASDAGARAVAGGTRDPAALTVQGEIVRARYGLVAALPWFQAALTSDAYHHPALIEYAATLGETGRYAEMLAATRSALAARPGSAQALYLQAVLAARAGRDDLARRLMQLVGGRLDGLAGVQLLNGALDFARGRDEQAVAVWRRLLAMQPLNVTARRLLAAALLRSGDANAALATLKPIGLRTDADAYTLTLVARAAEAAGERSFAARFIDRAAAAARGSSTPFTSADGLSELITGARQSPNDPTYAIGLIRGLAATGDIAAARAKAAELTAASPGAPPTQLALGDALAAANRYAQALVPYTRAADLDFDEPTMLRLVDTLGRTGQARDAAVTLALYLQQNPQSREARRLAAKSQIAGRHWADAIETLEGLRREIGNRDAGLLVDLSHAYAGAGDADIALSYGAAAYRLQPMNPAASDAYGWALALCGDTLHARQLLDKATALAPGDPDVATHRRLVER